MNGVYYTTNSTNTSAWGGGYTTTTTSGSQSMIEEKDFKIPPISEEDLVMHKLSDKCEWVYVNKSDGAYYKIVQKCRICGELKESSQSLGIGYGSGIAGGAGGSATGSVWGGGGGGAGTAYTTTWT